MKQTKREDKRSQRREGVAVEEAQIVDESDLESLGSEGERIRNG